MLGSEVGEEVVVPGDGEEHGVVEVVRLEGKHPRHPFSKIGPLLFEQLGEAQQARVNSLLSLLRRTGVGI
jgi:hypothetical protein